jgi:outer membrane murein-binding lipoprotein Lpp
VSRDNVRRFVLSFVWFAKWVLAPLILGALLIAGGVALYEQGIDFDTFLNYFALGLLIFVVITLFYGIIAIHDVPYEIAHRRGHPHQDAIHAAGWVSLFTLHALWPFLWIWAMLYRPDRGWGFAHGSASESNVSSQMDELLRRVEQLERQVERADLSAKPELIETRAKRAELPASTEPLATSVKRGAR